MVEMMVAISRCKWRGISDSCSGVRGCRHWSRCHHCREARLGRGHTSAADPGTSFRPRGVQLQPGRGLVIVAGIASPDFIRAATGG